MMNCHFQKKNLKAFWNKLKRHQYIKTHSHLTADRLAKFYRDVMSDDQELNEEQTSLKEFVVAKLESNSDFVQKVVVTSEEVLRLVKLLNHGVAPGSDGVTVEHLTNGMSPRLAATLADIYSAALSTITIPEIFCNGIIIG